VATSKVDDYRANACDCEQLAERTSDAHLKEQFLKTARQWWDMAAYEEKRWQR
jgi:hypothetical protein